MLRRIAQRMWDDPRWMIGIGIALLVLLAYYASYRRDQDDESTDSPQVVRLTFDEQATAYEASLRAETAWLWDNMIFTQNRSRPDDEHCVPRTFNRLPVPMDADARTNDDLGGKILDQLDYAALLVDQARAQWESFCTLHASGPDTIAFLTVRLTGAYDRLDLAQEALDARARSRGQ